jgi:hypothetical protein
MRSLPVRLFQGGASGLEVSLAAALGDRPLVGVEMPDAVAQAGKPHDTETEFH